tara:strand:- start:384 stop:509 length:126 start_codon:yes stop_codon:yes gene_type:complete
MKTSEQMLSHLLSDIVIAMGGTVTNQDTISLLEAWLQALEK